MTAVQGVDEQEPCHRRRQQQTLFNNQINYCKMPYCVREKYVFSTILLPGLSCHVAWSSRNHLTLVRLETSYAYHLGSSLSCTVSQSIGNTRDKRRINSNVSGSEKKIDSRPSQHITSRPTLCVWLTICPPFKLSSPSLTFLRPPTLHSTSSKLNVLRIE